MIDSGKGESLKGHRANAKSGGKAEAEDKGCHNIAETKGFDQAESAGTGQGDKTKGGGRLDRRSRSRDRRSHSRLIDWKR